jgi:hypothetical protein
MDASCSSSFDAAIFLSSIYKKIIHPLARAWSEPEIRGSVKDYLVVFKPRVS